ncbi:MAG: type II secretion system F family protein [Clostridia bacterium]|nr:type II secretion system F family protein [Clostridia bacterium]
MNRSDIQGIPHYASYNMKWQELVTTLLMAMGLCFFVGYIFYDNLIAAGVLSLAGVAYIPVRKKDQARKRKEILNLQFKDALYFLSVGLSAGKSMETALWDTQKSLEGIYPDGDSDMLRELVIMNQRIMMNEPIEKVFNDLAERSGLEDIKSFADIIIISKRAGANLIEVIRNTSATIREKVEIKQEIENLLAGKKLEQRILMLMPFIMVFLLKNSSNFLDPLMNRPEGRAVMTVALLMILAGQLIAKKIMQIEV